MHHKSVKLDIILFFFLCFLNAAIQNKWRKKVKDANGHMYFVVYINAMLCFVKAIDLQIKKKSNKGFVKGK